MRNGERDGARGHGGPGPRVRGRPRALGLREDQRQTRAACPHIPGRGAKAWGWAYMPRERTEGGGGRGL